MPSRRDQIQSYQFAVQRVVSALVAREADPAQTPLRRLVGAGLGSIMVAVISLAAVGIFGLVTGRSGAGWRDGSSVIIERETGAAFVYRDGVLIPTANFASAMLLANSSRTVTVSRAQLANEPRVPVVGIPNAPNSLPDPRRLLTGAWTLCTTPTSTPSGGQSATTAMLVGAPAPGGRPLGQDEGLIVKVPTSEVLYLVWHGYRYRIGNIGIVLDALGMPNAPRIAVGPAWLNALPQGQIMQPINQTGRGQPFPRITEPANVRVGQVLATGPEGAKVYFLVGTDQLRPLTEVEKEIVLRDPATGAAYDGVPEARPWSGNAPGVTRAPAPPASPDRWPDRRPEAAKLDRADAAICATHGDARGVGTIVVDASPSLGPAVPTPRRTSGGIPLVDATIVEPGRGAIVEAMPSPDATSGTLVIVTDLGIRYAVPSLDVLRALGYATVEPVRLPANLVARLPEGPALDPAVAAQPIQPTG
ncbi:MAG TPA: type VII secretion protein EccB [Micromonosporaceae bacterium]|nr:type VII secretion protein EccB [Micromonosporaceae bacterium]